MKRIFNKNKLTYSTALFILVLIIFYRSPYILTEGRFWAEEGSLFFEKSYTDGWFKGIFSIHSEGGYYNLFPRIASVLSTLLPLKYAPLAGTYLTFILMIYIIIFIFIANSDFLENQNHKILTSSLLVFAPSFIPAVWLNTLNAQIYLSIFALMLLFLRKKQNKILLISTYPILFISNLSGLYSCVLTPLFLINYLKKKNNSNLIFLLITITTSTFQFIIFTSSYLKEILGELRLNSSTNQIDVLISFIYNVVAKTFLPKEYIFKLYYFFSSFLLFKFFCLIVLFFIIFLFIKNIKINDLKKIDYILILLILGFILEFIFIFIGVNIFAARYSVFLSFNLILIILRINFKSTNKFFKFFSSILIFLILFTGIKEYRPKSNLNFMKFLDCLEGCNSWKEQVIKYENKNNNKFYYFSTWPYNNDYTGYTYILKLK